MADNTVLSAGTGGDTLRDIDKSGVKTQVVALDIGGSGAESLLTGNLPVSQSGTWTVQQGGSPWAVSQSGAWAVSVSNFPASQAVTGTFWQATQPISAAALPLPSGAATSAKQPALGAAGTPSADVITVQGVTSMTALKIDGSGVTQPVSGTFWQATQPVSGTFWQATQPVSIAAAVTVAQATAANLNATVTGTVTANQGGSNWTQNLAQVGGNATVTAATGVLKVGVVGNAGAAFDGATGSAVPANAVLHGARAATANPTNATGGNSVAIMADKAGRMVVTQFNVRELIGVQQTAVAATTETTIVTAGGAGVFNDLAQLVITTAGAAAQTITIKDATAGTTRLVLNYPNAALAPGTPMILQFNPPIPQAAANANWTVTQSAATSCNYTAVFVKNT